EPVKPAKSSKSTKIAPPFAVTPVGASVGKVAPAKALESEAFTLTEAVSSARPPASGSAETTGAPSSSEVTLSVPESMDAARGAELSTTVALNNGGDRPITTLYRAEMLEFTVTGPSALVSCGQPRTVSAPIRELFVTIPPKGKIQTSVLFTATCPAGTFDEPGIYRILPRLDATNASGRPIGLKTWDGVAVGKAPLLLRVRAARKPGPPVRPALD
ncbi:MAG TPA: hypothetical protein VM580_14025, partial [Labilithrix sp.]|nr:hypothetical protein [Labilithrix sp.]